MKRNNLVELIDNIIEANKIDDYTINREKVIQAFQTALELGCTTQNNVLSCRAVLDEEKREIKVYTQKYVVEEINPDFKVNNKRVTQILLEQAKKIKSKIKVGDILEEEINPQDFDFSAAKKVSDRFKNAVNAIVQERDFNYFKDKVGKIINAQILHIDEDKQGLLRYKLKLDNIDVTCMLYQKDILKTDYFNVHDRVKVLLENIETGGKYLKIQVSRTHPDFVKEIMKQEIPEILEGIVEIKGIARDPGDRTKVAVISHNPNIEAKGACIGQNGNRIKAVKRALNDENIDVFKYSDEPSELIKEALSPATVLAVTDLNPIEKSAVVIVSEDQYTLAIGKQGQNVRLAVNAIRWAKLDIKTDKQAKEEGIIY